MSLKKMASRAGGGAATAGEATRAAPAPAAPTGKGKPVFSIRQTQTSFE